MSLAVGTDNILIFITVEEKQLHFFASVFVEH